MKYQLVREILKTENTIPDGICLNGCEVVIYQSRCSQCGYTQDLRERSLHEKAEDIKFLVSQIHQNKNNLEKVPLYLMFD